MGYRGKPSASCERCRSRRLKCNYARPSCTACLRAGSICTGYRDQSGFGFLDQSEETARNYHRSIKKRPVAIVSSPGYIADPSTILNASTVISSPRHLTQPVQDIARCHLFANYMKGGPRTCHIAYLLPLVEDDRNKGLNAAVSAVALAAFANMHASPKTMMKAQAEYTTALSKTNESLKDPVRCKADDVLGAVILLGMFEITTCMDTSFVNRWMNHLDGASRLLEIRGPGQLASLAGLEMFTHLRAQIILSNIYQEKRGTPILAKLTEQISHHRPPKDRILDQLGLAGIKIADFLVDVKEGLFNEPSDVIQSALIIDAELVSLLITAHSSWNYKVVPVPTSHGGRLTPYVWGDTYHIYDSVASSAMWNNYRCARILLQELLLDTLNDINMSAETDCAFPQHYSLEKQCRRTALQLVEEICASVPYSLGSEIEADLEPALSSSASLAFVIPGSGGLTLIWPLLVAANSGLVAEDLRTWIRGCLDKVGHSTGIHQALATSRLLRDQMMTRAWLSPEYQLSTSP